MSAQPATVFVVDDEPAVRKALSRLLSAAGFSVRTFESPQLFLTEHDPSTPGCLVLDVAMPGLNGLQLQAALADSGCERSIIFLTGHGDIPMSVKAIKAGAIDFLTKPVDDEALLAAVRTALGRDRVARRESGELQVIQARLATLTPREREVLEHVVAGQLNKQIAADLGISEKTVKVHRGRVMEKMGVELLADLVRVAMRVGILDQSPMGVADGRP
jgi:FixJ family two-component response regulator